MDNADKSPQTDNRVSTEKQLKKAWKNRKNTTKSACRREKAAPAWHS